MTRETKIGLLVGLGFIVVFAMLLSHSAPAPSPGDSLQLAKARSEAASKLQRPVPQPAVESDAPSAGQTAVADSPISAPVQNPEPGSDLSPLPNPVALDPPVAKLAVNDAARTEATPAGSSTSDVLEMTRMAPALPEPVAAPEETARPETPAVSPEPVAPQPAEPARAVPSPVPPPAKEYVVQKGQTLGAIARAVYGTSSVKVMNFLVSANKGTIKNRDSVIEGQKLNIPQLPPDMFEPVGTNLNVAKPDAAQASKINELINRQAPAGVKTADSKTTQIAPPLSAETLETVAAPKTDLALKAEKSQKPEAVATAKAPKTDLKLKTEKLETAVAKSSEEKVTKETRIYEVQSKETFSSIAREQLGSSTLWKEIARLNKGVDPAKMKPGVKLKLPTRRPLADSVAAGKAT